MLRNDDGLLETLLPAATAGTVIGVLTVILATSYGALIFSGPLSEHLPMGVTLALVSAVVVGAVMAIFSPLRGEVSVPQNRVAPILAMMAGLIVADMGPGASPGEMARTVLAAVVASTLLTGIFLTLLGSFKLGNLIRFIPYPVVGGFLAGTGWLLVTGALRSMTGMEITEVGPLPFLRPESLGLWLPGTIYGVILMVALRRFRHFMVMPGMLILGFVAFYAWLQLAGVPVAAAREQGLLLGPFPPGRVDLLAGLRALSGVSWSTLAGQGGSLATVVLVSAVSILLNATAIELAAREEIDLDRELRVSGGANLAAGLGGGMVGFSSVSFSVLALKMGARTRLTGLVTAAVAAGALFGGPGLLELFPTALVGGILLYLGLSFLAEWLIDARGRMSRADFVVVLLILGVVGAFGYLEGVGAGIVAAVILFVVNYSQVDVVRHTLTAADHRSNVDRPVDHERVLEDEGDRAYILELQGYIFFGTATNVLDGVRRRLGDPERERPLFVVLDFRRVSGLDSSAVLSLVRMEQLAEKEGFTLVFTHVPGGLRAALREHGLDADTASFRVFPDLDRGIEWCEEELLRRTDVEPDTPSGSLAGILGEVWPGDVEVAALREYLERLELEPGDVLIRGGDEADALYLLESGRVTVELEVEGRPGVRLRTMGPGTVVGEMGLYRNERRSASVICDRDAVLHRLSADALVRMREEDPELAAAFHEFMARMMSERLAHTNRTVRRLLT